MVIKKDGQFFIILDMEPSLLSTEVNPTIPVISSLKDDSQVYLLPIGRKSAHQEISTDSSSSSHLSIHKQFILVSFLSASPDIDILWHSEFLYHNHYFLLLDLYISI